MGGDHGLGPRMVIPDYRIYKVEDCPELMKVQNALAAKGLKDPWLRNEVWRYNRCEWGKPKENLKTFFFRGFKWGLAAFAVTIALEAAIKARRSQRRAAAGGDSHH